MTDRDQMQADESWRVSTVFAIAKILAGQQELERMLSELMSCLVASLEPADGGVLLLYDPEEDRLVVGAAHGYDYSALKEIRLVMGEATCGKTFETGQPQVYRTPQAVAAARRNLSTRNRKLFKAAILDLGDAKSTMCVPMFSGKTRVGVLMLENVRRENAFSSPHVELLQGLCDLIALSIDNARLREEVRGAQALEETDRFKAELLSTLAHEMRTPLTAIKGYATALLMEDVSFSSERSAEFLHIIDRECDVLQELIHDFLESAILDAGMLVLEPQPVRLPRLVKGVVDEFALRSPQYRFLMDFQPDLPIADADPRRIEQVLKNLLDNAVKYSPEGGLIVVRGEASETEARISVADQGVGLAPEHLNRLFEKFFRVRSSVGHHVTGSGLGLPISRTIIEAHGGRIWAESQLGQGSTFYFTLPLDGLPGNNSEGIAL